MYADVCMHVVVCIKVVYATRGRGMGHVCSALYLVFIVMYVVMLYHTIPCDSIHTQHGIYHMLPCLYGYALHDSITTISL